MNQKDSGNKHRGRHLNWVRVLIIIFPIVFLDILIKEIVQRNRISTSNGFFDITYAQNTGTMWSLFANLTSANTIFIILSFLALGFLFYYLKTEKTNVVPVSIIGAGILGNLSDRIHYGYVIDWANFHFWPIFNIADAAIVTGVCWLVFILVRDA